MPEFFRQNSIEDETSTPQFYVRSQAITPRMDIEINRTSEENIHPTGQEEPQLNQVIHVESFNHHEENINSVSKELPMLNPIIHFETEQSIKTRKVNVNSVIFFPMKKVQSMAPIE